MSESLNKRLSYLSIADFNYLSARCLLLSGLANTGLRLSAEAFELLFKLFLLLANKIKYKKELSHEDLKQFKHKLSKTFDEVKKFVPVNFDSNWDNYFKMLEKAYGSRYPEAWREAIFLNDVNMLDEAYCYMRNRIIKNFPKEEYKKARVFGSFIIEGYNDDVMKIIKKTGGKTPKEIFELNNAQSKNFDITWNEKRQTIQKIMK